MKCVRAPYARVTPLGWAVTDRSAGGVRQRPQRCCSHVCRTAPHRDRRIKRSGRHRWSFPGAGGAGRAATGRRRSPVSAALTDRRQLAVGRAALFRVTAGRGRWLRPGRAVETETTENSGCCRNRPTSGLWGYDMLLRLTKGLTASGSFYFTFPFLREVHFRSPNTAKQGYLEKITASALSQCNSIIPVKHCCTVSSSRSITCTLTRCPPDLSSRCVCV